MRRPWLVIVVTVAGLLLIASPFLGAKWGSVDYRVLPPDAPAHVAAEKLSDFGPETSTAELLVRGASEADVAAYAEQVAEVDGVIAVQPVADRGRRDAAARLVGRQQPERAQPGASSRRSARSSRRPGRRWSAGSARTPWTSSTRSARTCRWMGLIVAGVMLVLLFIAFGSLVLPVKAIVMNLFSITAAFGVVTWIFSDGHLVGPARASRRRASSTRPTRS